VLVIPAFFFWGKFLSLGPQKKKRKEKRKKANVTFIHDFWGNKWPKLTRFGGKKIKSKITRFRQ
jgi:hypothetical protein